MSAFVAVGAGALAVTCGSPPIVAPPTPPSVEITRDVDYGSGGQLDVLRPPESADAPVLVLLHGCCGGREDMFQLAHELAAAGSIVFNAGWRTFPEGGTFPEVRRQAECAVGYARASAAGFGGDPARITLVGWSDGALLAAGVALSPAPDEQTCTPPAQPGQPDALIGISGFYGWDPAADPFTLGLVNDRTVRFFRGAPNQAGTDWESANPYRRVGHNPELAVLLLVGDRDSLLNDAECFAAALAAGGHPTRLAVLDRAGHTDLILPRTRVGRAVTHEILSFARGELARRVLPACGA